MVVLPGGISLQSRLRGGGRGIRTPGTVSRTVVFKTTRFNRSRIPPRAASTVYPCGPNQQSQLRFTTRREAYESRQIALEPWLKNQSETVLAMRWIRFGHDHWHERRM